MKVKNLWYQKGGRNIRSDLQEDEAMGFSSQTDLRVGS